MSLSEKEIQLLAGLTNDPAYILLLEKIQLIIDNLTDRLHFASPEATVEILPLWRSLRTVLIELKNTPQDVIEWAKQIASEKLAVGPPLHTGTTAQLAKFMEEFEKQQDSMRVPETIHDLYPVGQMSPKSFGNII